MGASGNLFLVLWCLAFLSPLAAIFFAVRVYAVHRRRRPERDRHLPVVAYVMILLVCAIIAFPFGLSLGISAACSGPGAGNLCGLFGVFVTGPFASSNQRGKRHLLGYRGWASPAGVEKVRDLGEQQALCCTYQQPGAVRKSHPLQRRVRSKSAAWNHTGDAAIHSEVPGRPFHVVDQIL